jgi:hypothetical protein
MKFTKIAIIATIITSTSTLASKPAQAFTIEDFSRFLKAMSQYTTHIQQDIIEPSQQINQPTAPVEAVSSSAEETPSEEPVIIEQSN